MSSIFILLHLYQTKRKEIVQRYNDGMCILKSFSSMNVIKRNGDQASQHLFLHFHQALRNCVSSRTLIKKYKFFVEVICFYLFFVLLQQHLVVNQKKNNNAIFIFDIISSLNNYPIFLMSVALPLPSTYYFCINISTYEHAIIFFWSFRHI